MPFFSQKNFIIVISVVALLILGSLVFVLINLQTETKEAPILTGPIRYNCELSGGVFQKDRCICPIEEELGQTQELMYDISTGFCQSTHGGPAGDAFNASIGLPYGEYGHWTGIMLNLCTASGGNISGVACNCPEGTTYNKTSGKCE